MANGDIIDGENERRSNFGRFINHSVRRANCQACDAWPSGTQMAAVYLETTRTIKAGDELLFDCARAPPENPDPSTALLGTSASRARTALMVAITRCNIWSRAQTATSTGTSRCRDSRPSASPLTTSESAYSFEHVCGVMSMCVLGRPSLHIPTQLTASCCYSRVAADRASKQTRDPNVKPGTSHPKK